MKTGTILATMALILGVSTAIAQTTVNMAQVTCEEMTQSHPEDYVAIGSWMSGYFNAKNNNTIVDLKRLTENSKNVDAFCRNKSENYGDGRYRKDC